jgi:hypothetical protein
VGFSPVAFISYSGTAVVQGNYTGGTGTFQVSGTGSRPLTPRTSFGDGKYLVGIGIVPGRYYSDPSADCGWIRKSTFPPSPGDDIASGGPSFDAEQWIVDILPSDVTFESYYCGTWSQTPATNLDSGVIKPGVWEVRTQIPQGRYRALAGAGCSWQRLRHFEGTPGGVIESGSTPQPGHVAVSIRSTDVGFFASEACGTWTRVS